MTQEQARQTDSATGTADEQRWADLVDLAQVISREILFRGYTDERAVVLSPSAGVVMRYLHHEPVATPSRIAAATGLQRTNLSTLLRALEQKGLVERHADPDDGRVVTVRLTERARTNYALVRRDWAASASEAANHDTEHLGAALTLLATVKAGLVRARTQTDTEGPARQPAR